MQREAWSPLHGDGSIDWTELLRPEQTAEPATWEVRWIDHEAFCMVDEVCCIQHRHQFLILVHDSQLWLITKGSRPSNITIVSG